MLPNFCADGSADDVTFAGAMNTSTGGMSTFMVLAMVYVTWEMLIVASVWPLRLDSDGTCILRLIAWPTLIGNSRTQTLFSHASGVAVQSGLGAGAGGLQQSVTT